MIKFEIIFCFAVSILNKLQIAFLGLEIFLTNIILIFLINAPFYFILLFKLQSKKISLIYKRPRAFNVRKYGK